MDQGKTLELSIESLGAGGDGVARDRGQVCFVPGAAPGDRLRARPLQSKGSWLRAEILEILEPGPGRVEPPCPLAGRCGGCQWQHLDLELQREAKRDILTDNLSRLGGQAELPPVALEGGAGLGYRRRAELQGFHTPEAVEMGFLAAGSHEMIAHESCPLLDPSLDAAAAELRAHLAGCSPQLFRFTAEMTLLEDGALQLLLRAEDRACAELLPALESWKPGGPDRVHWTLRALDRRRSLREAPDAPFLLERMEARAAGADLSWELLTRPGDFVQVNPAMNRRLVQAVLDAAAPAEGEWILDLYSGSGNLSLPLALAGARVLGVEGGRGAVRSARASARSRGLGRARFRSASVEEVLPALVEEGKRYGTVVLDPPRGGAPALAEALAPLGVGRIVAVSCHPGTLARDLKAWTEKGFRLESLRMLDFFPQTHHLETLAVLVR